MTMVFGGGVSLLAASAKLVVVADGANVGVSSGEQFHLYLLVT